MIVSYDLSVTAALGKEYDSGDYHHHMVRSNQHFLQDDSYHTNAYHNNATKSNRRGLREHRRRLQLPTPYFNTTALGDRNYSASYGNPLKGLAATAWVPETLLDHAIEFNYLPLSNVLKDFNTYNWTDLENVLQSTSSRKRQLVQRFFITYPPFDPALPLSIYKLVKMGTYTNFGKPSISPWYNDTVLLGVLQNFIFTFGAKYDGDKRIAYIQPGLLGFWGEYHVLNNSFLPQWVKDNVTTWFKQAFVKTPMMVRYPSATTKALNVGYHDDSYTWSTLDGIAAGNITRNAYFWPSIIKNNHSDAWRFSPIGGEVRPDNIPWVMKESYIAGRQNQQDFWLCTTTTHAVYMKYGDFDGNTTSSFAFQKGFWINNNMGYNYQLLQVSATLNKQHYPTRLMLVLQCNKLDIHRSTIRYH